MPHLPQCNDSVLWQNASSVQVQYLRQEPPEANLALSPTAAASKVATRHESMEDDWLRLDGNVPVPPVTFVPAWMVEASRRCHALLVEDHKTSKNAAKMPEWSGVGADKIVIFSCGFIGG